jgi:very-short-patch-repair endonuclease
VTEKVDADRSETMVVNGYTMMRILMVYILMVIENAVMSSYSWLFMAISGYQWLFMVMNVTCTLGS